MTTTTPQVLGQVAPIEAPGITAMQTLLEGTLRVDAQGNVTFEVSPRQLAAAIAEMREG